jgi:hypothetical protein
VAQLLLVTGTETAAVSNIVTPLSRQTSTSRRASAVSVVPQALIAAGTFIRHQAERGIL